MPPLICTTNTHSHVDYGIPIVAKKSTDYRTCTGTYHGFFPEFPQYYDCRVAAKIKPELKKVDLALRSDVKSTYNNEYFLRGNQNDPSESCARASKFVNVHFVRNVQEKMFQNPPAPIAPKLSEMKDSYRMNYYTPRYREVSAPSTYAKCQNEGLARPLQPAVPPEEQGYWKYLDIYMTDNKLRYPPYTQAQMDKARQDITTFHIASGKSNKTMKTLMPGRLTGNMSIYDRTVFKYQAPPRCMSRAPKHCPNKGLKSEYKGNYNTHTYSDLYPYLYENGVVFNESLAAAGPWQNMCPPGMYCTDYCHIGTGRPVRAVIETGKKEITPRKQSDY